MNLNRLDIGTLIKPADKNLQDTGFIVGDVVDEYLMTTIATKEYQTWFVSKEDTEQYYLVLTNIFVNEIVDNKDKEIKLLTKENIQLREKLIEEENEHEELKKIKRRMEVELSILKGKLK